jgi:hypothetical protein
MFALLCCRFQARLSIFGAFFSSVSVVSAVSALGLMTMASIMTGCGSSSGSVMTDPPPPPPVVGANVPTWHFDNARSGLNATETALTPQNVTPQKFGKLFSYVVDGYIYAQPLLVSSLKINGGTHNVVYVATENDSVYAFDSDSYGTGTPLWQVSLLKTGETPITNGSIEPVQGITSTPAIDLTSNTLYVVSMQTVGNNGSFRLHALDITTGAEKSGGPVTLQASVPGTNQDSKNGEVSLTTSCLQRAALLEANGSIFVGFGACHSGWLLSYDATTLVQTGAFNMSPDLNGEGTYGGAGGVWMGGAGPAADGSGNVYVTTGNGPYDGTEAFGDSVLKFDSQLHLLDHFTPYDWEFFDCKDTDLGAGGILLIPGTTEALAGGKSGKLYLLDTMELGGMQADDAGATQTLWFEPDLSPPYTTTCTDNQNKTWTTEINSYEIFGTAAYFNNAVYLGITPTLPDVSAPLRVFNYSGQLTAGPVSSDSILQSAYGTSPFVSASGTSNGIVWMIDHGTPIQGAGTPTAAILRAYDAGSLTEIYNSTNTSKDTAGYGIKFTSPIVANGKVYIGTAHDLLGGPNPQGELDVYGLKNQ